MLLMLLLGVSCQKKNRGYSIEGWPPQIWDCSLRYQKETWCKDELRKVRFCDVCQEGKQTKCSHKRKSMVSTSQPLGLLHLDFFDSHGIFS